MPYILLSITLLHLSITLCLIVPFTTCHGDDINVWVCVCDLHSPTDTEGSFVVERVVDMARAAIRHVNNVAGTNPDKGNHRIRGSVSQASHTCN